MARDPLTHQSKCPSLPACDLNTRPPNQPAAGSGLLGESQLSLRTECAYKPPSEQASTGHATLRTRTLSPNPRLLIPQG